MANRLFLLCLLISCLTVSFIDCRGGRSSGRSSSRGSSRSSSHSSWGSSSHHYPSSGSGLSGSGSSSRWGSSSHGYPSSGSGLSGSGSSSHGYPSSGSGLSGWGSSSHGYPSSGSGLSGSGSSSHGYPSSGSGLSGSGSSGSSGWSWSFGSGSSSNKYPSASSSGGTHSYPKPSSGLSGSGSSYYPSQTSYGTNNYRPSHDTSYHSSNTYHTNTGYGSSYGHGYHYNTPISYVPSYYTSPQYVYVHEYRHSDSRFGDLLTGLSLYNLGRSHSHYNNHYYHDDYYNRRYESSGSSYRPENTPSEKAQCFLRVKENGKSEVLKIPCEIVSTFTEGSKKLEPSPETIVNKTVCVTNSTIMNNTLPVNGSSVNATVTTNATMVNVSVCTTNSSVIDPLTVKGVRADANNMECAVEIHTKESLFRNNIDCKTLMTYARIPEPKKATGGILPAREKLKSWVKNPPWWMSMFIAV